MILIFYALLAPNRNTRAWTMDRMLCCRVALEVSNYWWWVSAKQANATI